MSPRFRTGDMVVIEKDPKARMEVSEQAVYAVETSGGLRLRYIRKGRRTLFFSSEQCIQCPSRWEPVSRSGREMLDIVRGRVVWVSRQLETK